MDARTAISDVVPEVVYDCSFSSAQKYFVVATDSGFSDTGPLKTAVMLGESQILALVGLGNPTYPPNRVSLYDFVKKEQQAAVSTSAPAVRVAITSTHLAIVLETKVNLYKVKGQIAKVGSFDTAANTAGLCCLGVFHLVIPGRSSGQMQIIALSTLDISILPAHSNALQTMALSPDGSMIASASSHGTLIRLHSTSTCAKLAELRRGVAQATVLSIAISPDSDYVACTSSTNTLHVFLIPKPSSSNALGGGSADQDPVFKKWGSLASLPFAPRVFTDTYSVVSATFDPGQETVSAATGQLAPPPRGLLGWLDEETIAVISGGRDARYERFKLSVDEQTGQSRCLRVGWSRYTRPN